MALRAFLFLFVTVPLVELYLLIELGRGIGGMATILLCVFTALLGGVIIRLQGMRTLLDARRELAIGRVPATHMLHGLMLGAAGLLLFFPGLLTDLLGFSLLVPTWRDAFARVLFRRWLGIPTPVMDEEVIEVEVVRDKHEHLP